MRVVVHACVLVAGFAACAPENGDRQTAAKPSTVRQIIAEGLSDRAFDKVPIGTINIMDHLESMTEREDYDRLRFPQSYLEHLKLLANAGIITYQPQKPVSALEETRRFGATTVEVVPTDKSLRLKDAALSTSNYLAFRWREYAVEQIIRDTVYSSPNLPSTDEYRLVLGILKNSPSAAEKEFDPSPSKESRHRFRALLKVDPFQKTLRFVTADLGDIGADKWYSENIK